MHIVMPLLDSTVFFIGTSGLKTLGLKTQVENVIALLQIAFKAGERYSSVGN